MRKRIVTKVVVACSVLLLFLWAAGCKKEETAQPSATPAAQSAETPALPVPQVSATMLPDVPTPMPGVEPNLPYFDDFSWREFIALTWPAQISTAEPYSRGVADPSKQYGDTSGPTVVDTWKGDYELFLPNGAAPAAWKSFASPSPCGGNLVPYQKLIASFNHFHGFNEASFGYDTGPLVDQQKHYIRYETSINQLQYDFIVNPPAKYPGPLYLVANLPGTGSNPNLDFPTGSIEVKAAWRVMDGVAPAQRARYYVTKAQLLDPVSGNCTATDVGLVGLHIVNKTAKFPNWVWSTFEHVDNVPANTGETPVSTGPYTLNDPAKPQVLNPKKGGKPIDKCNPPAANPVPPQVVREQAIAKSTQDTNNAYRNLAGVKGTVWENYMLTLTQWPISNGTDTFPNATTPAPPSNTANVAAETWYQKTSTTSCMACHAGSQALGDDFVYFLPIGAYNPSSQPEPCQAVNAFTRATKRLPMARRASEPNGQDKAVAALRKYFADHPPVNE